MTRPVSVICLLQIGTCLLRCLSTTLVPTSLLMKWIDAGKRNHVGSRYSGYTSYTAKQDRMMRLASVNYIESLDNARMKDVELLAYLERERADNQYMGVTMSGLRENSGNPKQAQFLRKFWGLYGDAWSNDASTELEKHWKRIARGRCPEKDFWYA